MAETVKNVVLTNSVWIEKFMHPLFQLHFVPFVLGVFIVLQLLKFLRYSKDSSAECGSNGSSLCSYTVQTFITISQKIWLAAGNFFYLYVAYEGVKVHGLTPRGFLPVVGIATFFSLLRWLLVDVTKISLVPNYLVSNTATSNFAKYSLYDVVEPYSAGQIDMQYVVLGTILALFSR